MFTQRINFPNILESTAFLHMNLEQNPFFIMPDLSHTVMGACPSWRSGVCCVAPSSSTRYASVSCSVAGLVLLIQS